MVGKNLSHYKILEELGHGGMGIDTQMANLPIGDTKILIEMSSHSIVLGLNSVYFFKRIPWNLSTNEL